MPPPPPSGEHGPLGPLTARHLTRRFLPPLIFVGALFWALFFSPWHRPTTPIGPRNVATFSGPTMGTRYQIKVTGAAFGDAERVAAEQAIARELGAVISAMSTYEPTSELSRLNQHQATTPVPISPALMGVLADAQRISEASGGAFDVTVGPLVNAWGFGPDGRHTPPTPAQQAALKARTGWQKLTLDATAGTATKGHPALYIDLSAIAKGYAVDRVAAALEALGHTEYMVEIGGEIRARGHNLEGQPWRIGIETPTAGERGVQQVISLIDTGMATSGDYRNFYERDGVRLSHTIDPRVGAPITHRLASVTVLHPRCALADAWATALNVLGPEAGLAAATKAGLAAYFLVRATDGTVVTRTTPAFDAALGAR